MYFQHIKIGGMTFRSSESSDLFSNNPNFKEQLYLADAKSHDKIQDTEKNASCVDDIDNTGCSDQEVRVLQPNEKQKSHLM